MKRIVFVFAMLLSANAVFAQNAEKPAKHEDVKVEQKQIILNKYNEIVSLLDKKDFTAAKQAYTAAEKLMNQNLEMDKKMIRKESNEDTKKKMERNLDSKTRLLEASKPFATADLATSGKRYAVYIMEFANVAGW